MSGDNNVGETHPQKIPRPADFTYGREPGWEHLSGLERREVGLTKVLEGLGRVGKLGSLPEDPEGLVAGIDPVVDSLVPRSTRRQSAVLVSLFEEDGDARVILTRRSSALNAHSGEVSFPGGRVDAGETFIEAALREAREEVSLAEDASTVVGWLSPLVTVASGSFIVPVVATLADRPQLTPAPAEVARIFDVSLSDLVANGVFHEERWRRGDRPAMSSADGSFPLFFFETAGELIWGATGRILYELCHLALGLHPVIA